MLFLWHAMCLALIQLAQASSPLYPLSIMEEEGRVEGIAPLFRDPEVTHSTSVHTPFTEIIL
jgi:hypothetical protein